MAWIVSVAYGNEELRPILKATQESAVAIAEKARVALKERTDEERVHVAICEEFLAPHVD